MEDFGRAFHRGSVTFKYSDPCNSFCNPYSLCVIFWLSASQEGWRFQLEMQNSKYIWNRTPLINFYKIIYRSGVALGRGHTNDDILYNNFLACDRKLLEIYCSRGLKKKRLKFLSSWSFFQKTTVVNLAENMCVRKTIMISNPIIQCCRCLLLSQLHQSRTHNNLVVHIGHVWPQIYHNSFNNPRS